MRDDGIAAAAPIRAHRSRSGCRASGGVPSSRGPGRASSRIAITVTMPISPFRTTRQRRPGARPVGYRIGTRRINATAGNHSQL